jgi:hypothetical protein
MRRSGKEKTQAQILAYLRQGQDFETLFSRCPSIAQKIYM